MTYYDPEAKTREVTKKSPSKKENNLKLGKNVWKSILIYSIGRVKWHRFRNAQGVLGYFATRQKLQTSFIKTIEIDFLLFQC